MEKINVDAINKIKLLENKDGVGAFSLLWIQAAEKENRSTQNHRFHHHAFFEIHCILRGVMRYALKDKIITVSEGQCAVIPPNVPHRVEQLSDDFCKLTVALDINNIEGISSQRAFVTGIDGDVMHTFSLISKYASEKHEYSAELINLWVTTAVYGIMEGSSYKLHTENAEQPYDTRFLKAKKYVEDNYDVFFSCEDVADYCRLSAKQLGRLFMQYEGISLSDFIKTAKLTAAKRMLLSTDKTQKRISEELGFSSESYFNKFFMKHEGVSPGEYKKRQGEG